MDLDFLNANQGPFMESIGLTYLEAGPDKLVATWTAGARHHQPFGIVHGGVHASVVETMGSIAGALWLGWGAKVVGVSNTTDFYRAVTEGVMTSTATPIHRGRSSQVWVVETRDDQDRLIARGQLRLQNLRD